jgi:hypothetical protein
LGKGVATTVITYVILHSPKKHECWDHEQKSAIRAKHSPHLFQTCDIVIQMLNDIQRGDQLERTIFKWQRLSDCLLNIFKAAGVTKSDCLRRNIYSGCLAKLREQLQVRASPAAHIQNLRTRLCSIS